MPTWPAPPPVSEAAKTSANCAPDDLKPTVLELETLLPMASSALAELLRPLKTLLEAHLSSSLQNFPDIRHLEQTPSAPTFRLTLSPLRATLDTTPHSRLRATTASSPRSAFTVTV
jgi:hypothetical protein